MLTRRYLPPAYSSYQPEQVVGKGVVRTELLKGIPQTWAIARPVSAPSAVNAPFYLGTHTAQYPPINHLIRAGSPVLNITQPHMAMDPSNTKTWQRPYLFST